MTTIVERNAGRYEVQEVEFGRVYKWRPERVVVECDCGDRAALTLSAPVCRCGADHTAIVREELADLSPEDETLHPWRYAGEREGAALPC